MSPLGLLLLVPALVGMPLPTGHPFSARARGAAEDVIAAVETPEDGIPALERATWARRAFIWGYYESAFTTAASGDGGASCGVLQVTTPERWLTGATCARVKADRVLGFRVGITVMRMLVTKCGSVRAGLTAYATDGACHPWTLALVERRLRMELEAPKP